MPASSSDSSKSSLAVDLALQGGGAHGAFTWGVLDRLLEEPWIDISGISGTSAGAMNAVALASGWAEGGHAGARETLRRFWEGLGRAPLWPSVADSTASQTGARPSHELGSLPTMWDWGQLWLKSWSSLWTVPTRAVSGRVQEAWWRSVSHSMSPYAFNPLNLNPLRDLLAKTINFEAVRASPSLRLFIAATHVRTGRLRLFRQQEVTVDVLLASACLPLMFQAVHIDGEAYWDGGYAGNPSLLSLLAESPADDLILVQINPRLRETVPTRARDILDRMNEVTFNSSLIKELRSIALLKYLIEAEGRPTQQYKLDLFRRVEMLRIHRIDGGQTLASLRASTKLDARWAFLSRLHRIGREAAEHWLSLHHEDLGKRGTVNLDEEFMA